MKPTQELIEWLESKANEKKRYIDGISIIFDVKYWSEYNHKTIRIYNELILLIEALKNG